MKRLIQKLAFLFILSLSELSLSQTCPQSEVVINGYLEEFQSATTTTVVYAWTGAHYLGNGLWKDRKNPTNSITSSQTGGSVSQAYASTYSHTTKSDKASASANAKCTNAKCTTASLSTSACITSKVDSAGAGAYARAGKTVPPDSRGVIAGTIELDIPNRMTLTSNVGDESGVWGLVVSTETLKYTGHKPRRNKSLVHKGPLVISPFLVDRLGMRNYRQFNVRSNPRRLEIFAVAFELDPQGKSVMIIGPEKEGLMSLTDEQKEALVVTETTLKDLLTRFVIKPCPANNKKSYTQVNESCHVAEYALDKGEKISIKVPYDFPSAPENAKKVDKTLYIETAFGGRDHEVAQETRY